MKKNELNITSKMTVKELLDEFPETANLLFKRKMTCVSCPAEAFATLREVAISFQIDLNEFITEIKQVTKKQT